MNKVLLWTQIFGIVESSEWIKNAKLNNNIVKGIVKADHSIIFPWLLQLRIIIKTVAWKDVIAEKDACEQRVGENLWKITVFEKPA